MLNINTNYSRICCKRRSKVTSSLDTSMERLSTGNRINYARDDAAGLAISTRLEKEINSLAMASRNAADAQSMIDTVDGALKETQSILVRMKELAVQASNGTLIQSDRDALDAEFQALEAEIDRINSNTTFAGETLFNGSTKPFKLVLVPEIVTTLKTASLAWDPIIWVSIVLALIMMLVRQQIT